jgi:hypothetical protein
MATAALHIVEGLSLRAAYRAIRQTHPDALPDHVHWDALRAHFNADNAPPLWEIWQAIVLSDAELDS